VELTLDSEDDHGIRAKLLVEGLDDLNTKFLLSAHLNQALAVQS
jgi:hypothetical protein